MATYYTGVGSRATPAEVLERMTATARERSGRGWVLRSGGADGADRAFEAGAGELKEVWLPWRGFNGSASQLWLPSPEAFELAKAVCPHWWNMSRAAQKLHARNVHQVLGADLRTPSIELVCWTPGGADAGGTRTAIVVAREWGIPTTNLGARA